MDGHSVQPVQGATQVPSLQLQPEETERKARVDAVWSQMSKGVSAKKLNAILNRPSSSNSSSSSVNRSTSKKNSSQISSSSWMTVLGLAPKKTQSSSSHGEAMSVKQPKTITTNINCNSDEAKRIAASALSAVRDAAILAASSAGRGSKIEIKEVRDFAGEEVEVKKLVDSTSKEASEKGKASAVDAVLEQIRKKPKLSVLDKTKKDWGEFKEENKLDEELDAYKKSGNQYLEKVSFLQRADYREFERERDVRLALQAKRKPDA